MQKYQQLGQEIGHDQLLERSTPGVIAAATSSTKGKIVLLKDSTKADERDLLDHGLNLVIHSDPLDPAITTLRRENF